MYVSDYQFADFFGTSFCLWNIERFYLYHNWSFLLIDGLRITQDDFRFEHNYFLNSQFCLIRCFAHSNKITFRSNLLTDSDEKCNERLSNDRKIELSLKTVDRVMKTLRKYYWQWSQFQSQVHQTKCFDSNRLIGLKVVRPTIFPAFRLLNNGFISTSCAMLFSVYEKKFFHCMDLSPPAPSYAHLFSCHCLHTTIIITIYMPFTAHHTTPKGNSIAHSFLFTFLYHFPFFFFLQIQDSIASFICHYSNEKQRKQQLTLRSLLEVKIE